MNKYQKLHYDHCCKYHGCKYKVDTCPVVMGSIDQLGPCIDCEDEDKQWDIKVNLPSKTVQFLRELAHARGFSIEKLSAKLIEEYLIKHKRLSFYDPGKPYGICYDKHSIPNHIFWELSSQNIALSDLEFAIIVPADSLKRKSDILCSSSNDHDELINDDHWSIVGDYNVTWHKVKLEGVECGVGIVVH